MATITHSKSEAGSTNYHFLFDNRSSTSPSHARPITTATQAPAAYILKCGICLEDFEWFSLKDLPGYQGGPGNYNSIVTDALPLLPRIAKKPISILCGHAHNRNGCSRQRRIRFTSARFGGRRVLHEEQEILEATAASDADALFEPEKRVSLKLGCSLHTERDHAFCMECSARYIDMQVKAHVWPVVCPKEKCGEMVSAFAVEALLGDDAVKWHALGIEYAVKKKIYCPNLACGMLIDGELHDDTEPVDVHCPYCKKPFCAMCLASAHQGSNCDKRQDKLFENLADASQWRNCPACRQKIEKASGCNHISCRCGAHFCYVCGGIGTRCSQHG
ncbi:hypothetical protein K457DRAFT_14481 [Linnemannia elongata AG-77]|uniref:RBR-type E3 ubiquitin transferase n=1 Tax=Linnemannia elongata AG-77 TaxID=1314771 RepID=A0A197K9B0_9FUNG|nr:hypothetical protein K457DRAFT_14481 [Linnemannia elongata AG-77]